MTQNTANYWIDLLIFILMLVCFVSGIVIWVWPKNKSAHMGGAMPTPTPTASAPADVPKVPKTAPEIREHSGCPEKAERTGSLSGMETVHTLGNSGNAPQHAYGNSGIQTAHTRGNSDALKQSVHGGHGGQGSGKTFLGLTRRQWKWLHIWPSVVVLGPFLILHLLMHLKWCVKTTQYLFGFGKKTA